MDAQNAGESTSAPRRGVSEKPDETTTATVTATTTTVKSPIGNKITSSSKESKHATGAANAQDDDAAHERDSDAETIVLPGKDGISPSKPRKLIKHEDQSDSEISAIKKHPKDGKDGKDGKDDPPGRKKRLFDKERSQRKDGSSGLSSAPTSPRSHHRNLALSHRRGRTGEAAPSGSDSESPKPRSPKVSKDKIKSVDRLLSNKRKAPKAESDDEAEARKARRPRISDTSIDASLSGRIPKDQKSSSGRHHDHKQSTRTRSVSPHARAHRRSISHQLPSQSANGLSSKKRRVPAPLQSTDYHSDDSSSGSPYPRSSRLKSIATPVTGDSTASPAKMAPHKKHLDAHGQTLFAKACAKGEYDIAKMRLQERPEDLNFADHAGNTPLQVASLNGHEDIVDLLINAGCNLECRNDVKDTPLLDAVENGHLGVVKLLLAAGVNPRKPNAEGQEPLEKVPDDLDNAEEIRQALIDAKQKMGELRRTSEDHQPHDSHDTVSSHGPDSPRRSPPISGSLAASRRGGTVRSTKTSNHLLYMSLDDKTLRHAAARGDQETVTRILQVKESCDDAEALVAAARGGHNVVMELLLALGGANPDPAPVKSLPPEHSTPMLAAIGGENVKVIQLLLNQSGFDPTRRFKGEMYYEIARRREGPMWKEEEHILKNAYDDYKKNHKKTKSPIRREQDQESKRNSRAETLQDSRSHKRRQSSPPRDPDSKKKSSSNKVSSSPKEKLRSQSFGNDEQVSPKRTGTGRAKKEEKAGPSIAVSDREPSPPAALRSISAKPKRAESDVAGSSEGETVKPRRKLISGKDLKGHREKQRRASLVSNMSTSNVSTKEASDRGEGRHDDVPEKGRAERLSEKYHDRTKALKRDDSRDRMPSPDGSGKRHRSSVTPPRHGSGDKDDGEAPIKRRRLDIDAKEKRAQHNPSPEERQRKREVSRDSAKRQKPLDGERRETSKLKKANHDRRESEKSSPSEKASITVFSEEMDVDVPESTLVVATEDREAQAEREREESKKRQAELEAAAAAAEVKKKEEEKRREEEEKQKREAEEKRRQEETEKKRVEDEARRRREEEEREKERERERKRKEEEERARLEEEQKKREEEERLRREEEERKQREEEERKKREEEERLRREKEAAEEARRLREEEERKERERKRALREAELLRQRQEAERIRLSKLPPLLRWLDGCPDPKQTEFAELFTIIQGVRYDTINTSATGRPGGREQWILNTQVALLLGEKDLSLSRYTAWERIPVSNIAKRVIWRVEQDRYALTEGKLYHLGEQLPDYYGGDPHKVGYQRLEKLRGEASKLFFDMEGMFFVKESDFLYILPNFPHLRNVRLSIYYRELPEHESQLMSWSAPSKWKQDPDANSREGFAPGHKYYINGQLVAEDRPGHYKPSPSPFPESRVPRRGGIVAVTPDEPDYARLCMEQGLSHLLSEQQKMSVINGAHLTPRSMTSNETGEAFNGENHSPSAPSPPPLVNGIIYEHQEKPLVNGINGTASIG